MTKSHCSQAGFTSPAKLAALVLLVSLSACSKKEETDYCKNHYQFHAEHADTLGHLDMSLNADGLMETHLRLPVEIFAASPSGAGSRMAELVQTLSNNQDLYTLQTQKVCQPAEIAVAQDGDQLTIKTIAACGADNRLKQVDVSLLDVIPELEEIEVNVTTEATAKHFAISRQCSSAIFRLGQRPKQ